MKPLILHFAAALLLSATAITAFAQEPSPEVISSMRLGSASEVQLATAVQNYIKGLQSGNDGLTESCLFYAVRIRLAYPATDLRSLEHTIDSLVRDGRTAHIRYLASLASTLFASPALVDRAELEGSIDIASFFTTVSNQLQRRLIVRSEQR